MSSLTDQCFVFYDYDYDTHDDDEEDEKEEEEEDAADEEEARQTLYRALRPAVSEALPSHMNLLC